LNSEQLNSFDSELKCLKEVRKDNSLSKSCRERIKNDLIELKKEIDSLIFDIEIDNL
jgi:hypothetical protein